ncbi:hypothetical protein NZK33_13340 [Cyanobium sp. FGCU-6]|nr:hypothetical protein [Cyanobium sp. FGCU6]
MGGGPLEGFLGPPLERLGGWLLEAEAGVGLVLLVGLSMSLSHAFALLANRLTPRQIALRLVLDGLVLALAFLLASIVDMLLLATVADRPVHPTQFVDGMGAALIPGLFYGLVAAPYIADLLAIGLWFLVHLNVVALLHLRFALPWAEALLLATPGFLLALVLVALLFRQSWRGSYLRLAGSIRGCGSGGGSGGRSRGA